MKLKRVFAGIAAAALMTSALAVSAFAAEPADEENCLGATYVMINIPYSEFYAAVGVESAGEVDAVTSATKTKTRAGNLAGGSYHVNADGSDITGVTFPVRVLTPQALKKYKEVTDEDSYDITVTLRGSDVTTNYSGAEALFENETYAYYVLDNEPSYYVDAWYNIFTGKLVFGKVKAASTTVDGVSVELKTPGKHADYELVLNGFDLDTSVNEVYGVVLTTNDGAEYGLHHVTNIWRGTEVGFSASDTYYASIIGKTVTQITYYTANGVYTLPVNVAIPALAA